MTALYHRLTALSPAILVDCHVTLVNIC
ncbi:hypothetical protein NITHO_4730003 [Nitrolancea hollandica Lb]|uniref:Uncharacterized protein n=1 Tax=Nitrolancea hollandica Lb TaxID=1129897 RepID=I4EKQ6_9BACT|nr:hypothetical protein NITHO_4730003 [Nitrolancea hollandica Lb]